MTTMTSPTASIAHQKLIDARLNTIDRMLIDCVPRSDRLAIVREVESQIFEQLSDCDPSTLSREDVLEVLRRLDPPEAFLPDEDEEGPGGATQRPIAVPSGPLASTSKKARYGGLISGLAGIAAFVLILVECMMVMVASSLSGNEITAYLLLFPAVMLGIASTVVGVVMGIRNRRQGAWPILGLIFSAMAFPIWALGSFYLLLMILS